MTLRELKNEVYSLSFIPTEETGTRFIYAVRRALAMIYSELRLTSVKKVLIPDIRPISNFSGILHKGNESASLPLAGRAYYLRLSGKGHFIVRNGVLRTRYDFDSDCAVFRGFIKNEGKIEFLGEFCYTVERLLTFSELISDRLEDIPDGEAPRINLDEFKDFSALAETPKDSEGNEIPLLRHDGNTVTLPEGFVGEVTIRYIRRPYDVFDDDGLVIDLAGQYLSLLAPLVTFFILLDDDASLAESYKEIYEQMLLSVKQNLAKKSAEFVKTNGWA